MEKANDELKPCPFCGSPAEHFERVDEYGFFTSAPGTIEQVIQCSNRDCNILLEASGKTFEEAKAIWNTRSDK